MGGFRCARHRRLRKQRGTTGHGDGRRRGQRRSRARTSARAPGGTTARATALPGEATAAARSARRVRTGVRERIDASNRGPRADGSAYDCAATAADAARGNSPRATGAPLRVGTGVLVLVRRSLRLGHRWVASPAPRLLVRVRQLGVGRRWMGVRPRGMGGHRLARRRLPGAPAPPLLPAPSRVFASPLARRAAPKALGSEPSRLSRRPRPRVAQRPRRHDAHVHAQAVGAQRPHDAESAVHRSA